MSESKYIHLYHGTSREEEFFYPKYKAHPIYIRYSPFSWFTTSQLAAERYARLNRMNGENGSPRVLCYVFHEDRLPKMLDITSNIEEYASKVFGEHNWNIKNYGKHSAVFRITSRQNFKENPRMHFNFLKDNQNIGIIEKGGISGTFDWVFLEDNFLDIGAHKYLDYVETIYL